MGLKTNSKKAIENIRNYINNNFDGTNYGIEQPDTFEETARIILNIFESEKHSNYGNRQALFLDWCAGLPSILDTCYYYNRSAVDDLGEILEQTEDEKKKYNESKAEETLTILIYRELIKGVA